MSGRTRRYGMAAALAVATLSLTGCSSSEKSPAAGGSSTIATADHEAAVKIVKQDLSHDDDPNALVLSDSEAECAARATVDSLGVARLQQAGMDLAAGTAPKLTQPPLTETEADALYGIYGRCADLRSKVAGFLAADGTLSPSQAACVAGRYESSGLLRQSIFGADFDQALNDKIDQTLAEATDACA